jgi:hypothetical protein
VEYASVSLANQARAKELEDQIGEFSAVAHAVVAKIAKASAEFDAIGGWGAGGIRSFPHWLTIKAGFDMHAGAEILRVGQAMNMLPKIAEAFAAGQLSFDKVRQITTVATPATEAILLEIAQGASGSQLARICRELRRIKEANEPAQADEHLSRRGIWMHWCEDGMLELKARLTPEDAAVVQAALESITGSRPVPEPADGGVQDPADDRWAARQADALVAMCEHVVAGGAENLIVSTAARQVVVHIDAGVLTGELSEGGCFVEGGSPLSVGAARRIGCDAAVVGVVERNGLPIDVGRKQRIVPERLRLALHVRDRFCRFPGCGVPAHRTEAHHYEHWAFGGETNLDNLLLLCGFHHRRHHDGAYRIRKTADGYSFETDDGQVIGTPARESIAMDRDHLHMQHPDIGPRTPEALWGGEEMQFSYAASAIWDAYELAEARAPDG